MLRAEDILQSSCIHGLCNVLHTLDHHAPGEEREAERSQPLETQQHSRHPVSCTFASVKARHLAVSQAFGENTAKSQASAQRPVFRPSAECSERPEQWHGNVAACKATASSPSGTAGAGILRTEPASDRQTRGSCRPSHRRVLPAATGGRATVLQRGGGFSARLWRLLISNLEAASHLERQTDPQHAPTGGGW